ncbi:MULTISPECIES: hypothetical protein [Cyanophyceae]|uniref:hypothetical protein n=1 Tax=Cyanophyceae TaxID=3028117 RepID=UPI0018F040CD|nr:hypothetical protein [Trichocoleus sp. FACHB-69]
MTQPNLLELARTGDAKAIEAQINHSVQPKGITAKASLKDNILQVMLESAPVPDQQAVVPLIRDGLIGLGIESFKKVKIYGRETGEDFPEWQQEFELDNQVNLPLSIPETNIEAQSSTSLIKADTDTQLTVQKPSFFGSMFGAVAGAAGVVGGAVCSS